MVYTPRVGGCGWVPRVGDRVRFTDEELHEENGNGYIKALFPVGDVVVAFRHDQMGANVSELILLTAADPEEEKQSG